MNSIKSLLTILCMLLSFTSTAACSSDEGNSSQTSGEDKNMSAIEFAQSLGMGWNLGNNFDAHIDGVSNETGWGNPKATQRLFDALKKAGFSSVRIPVTWMGHIDKAPGFHVENAFLNRVAEVAGYAKKAGLKCIINIHHDGFGAETDPARKGYFWLNVEEAAKDENRNQEIKQKLAMLWMQIASRFKDEGDWLVFETLNEIHDGKWGSGGNLTDGGAQYRVLNEWNQLCVDVIRGTGGENKTRFIGIPGYVCQPWLTIQQLALPTDETPDRLLVAVHMYDPWDYAGSAQYSEWGHTGVNVVPDKSGEKEYVATLDALYNKFVRKGIPVYLGEYGCVHRNNSKAEAFRKYYLEYTIRALSIHKMPVFVWDNGSRFAGDDGFGLMEHDDGKFINNGEEIVNLMVKAWNNKDADYTLESIYNHAPQH